MKLSPRDAPTYFAKPDATKTGLLIYGSDAMRVALRRQEVVKALIGENGEDEQGIATHVPSSRPGAPMSLRAPVKGLKG